MEESEPRAAAGTIPEEAGEAATEVVTSHRGYIAEWVVTVVLLLLGTTFLVQAYVIPTSSMEDTLLVGDHLLVDKLTYAPAGTGGVLPYRGVKRGDIIVFRYPEDISETFIKRCVGVPGDRIRLDHKRLVLNGKLVEEPYAYFKSGTWDPYRDNFPADPEEHLPEAAREMLAAHVRDGEVVVPEDMYFAMGDNRDFSLDSRYWGFVPRKNIIGKPLLVYWSYDASTQDLTAAAFSPRRLADLVAHFPTRTRWKRTGRMVRGYSLQ